MERQGKPPGNQSGAVEGHPSVGSIGAPVNGRIVWARVLPMESTAPTSRSVEESVAVAFPDRRKVIGVARLGVVPRLVVRLTRVVGRAWRNKASLTKRTRVR